MAMRCAAIAFAQRSWAKVLVVVGKRKVAVFYIYIYVLYPPLFHTFAENRNTDAENRNAISRSLSTFAAALHEEALRPLMT